MMSGWTMSVTGFSAARLGISEIGVSFPDASFGVGIMRLLQR